MKKKFIKAVVVIAIFMSSTAMADGFTTLMDRAVEHSGVERKILQGEAQLDIQLKRALKAKKDTETFLEDQKKLGEYYELYSNDMPMSKADMDAYWDLVMQYGFQPVNMFNSEYYQSVIYPRDIAWREIEQKRAIMKDEIEELEGKVKLGACKVAYGYFDIREAKMLQQKQLEYLKANQKILKEKYDKGMISNVDVEKNTLDVQNAEYSISNLELDESNILMEFSKLIGESDFSKLKIDKPKFDKDELLIKELSEYIASAKVKRYEAVSKQLDYSIKVDSLNKAKDLFYGDSTIAYTEVYNAWVQAKTDLESTLNKIEQETTVYYLDMLTAKANVERLDKNLKLATQNFDEIKTKQLLGYITNIQLKGAELEYLTILNSYDKAIRDFDYAKLQLIYYSNFER